MPAETKVYKDEPFSFPHDPVLKKCLDRGIPAWYASFQSAVNNADDTPENFFSSKSSLKSRNVRMWWINGDGLLCCHKGEWFTVPAANVRFTRFIDENR